MLRFSIKVFIYTFFARKRSTLLKIKAWQPFLKTSGRRGFTKGREREERIIRSSKTLNRIEDNWIVLNAFPNLRSLESTQQPCPIRCNSTCYYLKSPSNLSIFRWDSWNERHTEQIYRFSKYELNLLLKIQFYSREIGMDAKTKISSVFFKGKLEYWDAKRKKRGNTYLDQSHPNPMYQLVTFFNNHERGYVFPSHHPITVIESGHDDTHAYQIYSKSQRVTRCSRSPREGRRARRVTSPWYSITREHSDRQTGGWWFFSLSQWRFKYRRNIITGN